MNIQDHITDDAIIEELGQRLARLRLDQDMTQAELAHEAGVGVRTVQRLEAGTVAPQLTMFIRICRALGIVEHFNLLVPEPIPSPMQQLKMRGKLRKRASGKSSAVAEDPGPWKWADGT
jgi:transcriptional regulator with XRE-family HTH domain